MKLKLSPSVQELVSRYFYVLSNKVTSSSGRPSQNADHPCQVIIDSPRLLVCISYQVVPKDAVPFSDFSDLFIRFRRWEPCSKTDTLFR